MNQMTRRGEVKMKQWQSLITLNIGMKSTEVKTLPPMSLHKYITLILRNQSLVNNSLRSFISSSVATSLLL